MREAQLSRRLIVLLVAVVACARRHAESDAARYLHDARFRRAELAASLVNPANDYSQIRLTRYPTWERLPEWNPRVAPVAAAELDAPGGLVLGAPLPPEARALAISDAARAGEEAALVALGADAFFRYPAQASDSLARAGVSRAALAGYGFWMDERAGGLVRVGMADGRTEIAYTCATCHASVREGHVVAGVGNASLDLGRLIADMKPEPDPMLRTWGPGRLDVSTDGVGDEPVRLPDLRPVRWLPYLQVNATVRQRGVADLALRLETLLITSHAESVRPPREVVLGLALYLWSLAPPGPGRQPEADAERRGRALFERSCRECHHGAGFTGEPVAIDDVGVDDAVARSPARGTGMWRVPSLLGVSTRGPLFHDASVTGVDDLLDPSFRRGPGHRFGLDLASDERADLTAYLRTL